MKYLYVVLSLLLITSCSLDDVTDVPEPIPVMTDAEIRALNDSEITNFIEANNLEAQTTESGLYFVINEQGTGTQPTSIDDVTVAYRGYFTNNTTFDEQEQATFNLQEVIPGWTEGIQLFNEGGSGMLLIPSRLAYGRTGIPGFIPGNAVLIFDINLIAVN